MTTEKDGPADTRDHPGRTTPATDSTTCPRQKHDEAILGAALKYAESGIHVFPARVGVKPDGSKDVRPIADWRNASTIDPATLRRWFGPDGAWRGASIAIDCGKSELVVVDLDVKDGRDGIAEWERLNAPATWRAATPSGGAHLFYRAPERRVISNDQSGKVAPGVDIRGLGGLVIAAPSIDPRAGQAYRWLEGTPEWKDLPPLPDVVVQRMTQRAEKPASAAPTGATAAPGGTPWTPEQASREIDRWLTRVAGEQPGSRNGTLNAAAVRLGHFVPHYLPERQAADLLTDKALAVGLEHREIAATIRSGLTRGMAEPYEIREPPEVESGGAVVVAPCNLPDDFWEARDSLRLIRATAHARNRSADAALAGVLAHYAATAPPMHGPDTGIGGDEGISLNFYVAVVARSGAGKSSGLSVAKRLIPQYMEDMGRDARMRVAPLGSGEGLAEAYMGTVEEEKKPAEEGKKPTTVKVRKKVRDHALVTKDEGAELVAMMDRQGATVGAALRSAWCGAEFGAQNGRAETTRIIDGGTYSLGFTIGFQEEAAAPLFSEAHQALGMTQRFIWLSAEDPSITGVVNPDFQPQRLKDADPWQRAATPGPFAAVFAKAPRMTMEESIKARLRAEDTARQRGDLGVEPLDSQKPAALIKLASLLALIECRTDVTEDDWTLAEMVWRTSRAVQGRILACEQRRRERAEIESVKRTARKNVAVSERMEQHKSARVERVAAVIARAVHGKGRLTPGTAKNALSSKGDDRAVYTEAVEHAVEQEWIKLEGKGLLPGPTQPPSDGR